MSGTCVTIYGISWFQEFCKRYRCSWVKVAGIALNAARLGSQEMLLCYIGIDEIDFYPESLNHCKSNSQFFNMKKQRFSNNFP